MSEIKGQVLVVDDNRMNRMKLSHSLEQQGYTVALAENGRQALHMLQEQSFDVVLLDIVMPEMDGYEVLAQMKADAGLRNIPVIVISALDELDSAVRCIEMGAEDYLPKQFNPVFLKARLDASLRRKKLRDLEQAYLRQEVMLRQSEKLATLGRLSAGMAHELNNPAAAAQRGVEQIRSAFEQHLNAHLTLDGANLSTTQAAALRELFWVIWTCKDRMSALDAITQSDREAELEQWLEENGVEEAWDLAPALVTMGYSVDELARLQADFTAAQLPVVLTWLVSGFTIFNVLDEIGEGTRRISEIVKALKTYTYLDQAPVQNVDVHTGLENTLVMFRSRLKQGVIVHRYYAQDLPLIEAYGSELNQVWTNIIDNAIAAMNGKGEISLHTRREGNWVVVEISDNGPGIPKEIQSQIFDPFFTTKPPGEGTGLGLNISHNIIVQKHKGEISVTSEPGKTCFQVKLPLTYDR
ncbi:MAG: response regulator [Anaerolineae bacterium]|nr:response regulator [Anaerolineae bacterium]